jgi:hypothetical protein
MKTEEPKPRTKPKLGKTLSLRLPDGNEIAVRIPAIPASETNLEEFVVSQCRFYIPISQLREAAKDNRWPCPKVLQEEPGSCRLEGESLWSGKKADWEELMEKSQPETAAKQEERRRILTELRTARKILRGINPEGWASLQSFLSIRKTSLLEKLAPRANR